jgi:hypothetical protein
VPEWRYTGVAKRGSLMPRFEGILVGVTLFGMLGALTVGCGVGQAPATKSELASVTAVLLDAQIKSLPTAPVILVPAPGAHKRLDLASATLYLDDTAGEYGNVSDPAHLVLSLNSDDAFAMSNFIFNDAKLTDNGGHPVDALSKLFETAGQWLCRFSAAGYVDSYNSGLGLLTYPLDARGAINQPLTVHFDNNHAGDLVAGNAANRLTIHILYQILDVP